MIGPTEVKRLKKEAVGRSGSARDEVSEIENPSSVFYGDHCLTPTERHSDRMSAVPARLAASIRSCTSGAISSLRRAFVS